MRKAGWLVPGSHESGVLMDGEALFYAIGRLWLEWTIVGGYG